MNIDKRKLLRSLSRYAIENEGACGKEIINGLFQWYQKMCEHICETECGGVYHCTDGCPIFEFKEKIKGALE